MTQQDCRRLVAAILSALGLAAITPPANAEHPSPAERPSPVTPIANRTLKYPTARVENLVDQYHGRVVADPYRWLEDVESPETAKWVTEENELTRTYLDSLASRPRFRDRLETLWNYSRTSQPVHRGDHYFYTHNDGLQNQSVLYVAPAGTPPDELTDARRVLIDPNTLSPDGTIALGSWHPSDDGKRIAYSIADGGSDWRTWRVMDVTTGQTMEDEVKWSKFSGAAWAADGSGFYYARYNAPVAGQELTGTNEFQKLAFHQIGTPQSADRPIYSNDDEPKWGFSPTVTEDGRYLIIENWRSTEPKSQIFVQDLQQSDAPVVPIITGFDADFTFVASVESVLYFMTDHEAPHRRLIAVNIAGHERADTEVDRRKWVNVISATEDVLQDVSLLGEHFYASYLSDALGKVVRTRLDGTPVSEVTLPGKGSVSGFGGRQDSTETFYTFTNYVTPPSIFRVDVSTGQSELWLRPKVAFDVDQYVTEQVFCQSKDGTRVPILITRRRGIEPTGDHRTLLYAYGGFNISLTPSYSPAIAAWLDSGGIYAVANLRGGGEYGSSWHESGMKLGKQNVFDDFIAASEHLIDAGWTTPDRLGIRGGSNGGLLVGAVMTQRPELFGACLPAVGVMDMLRYHKFTIGWAWVDEFGSSDDATQIDNLLSYSPLHNLRPGVCYPATMVTTADRDDRVVPGHSFKFAAALQAAQSAASASSPDATCNNPTLIRIETRAGHGAGTPTSKQIDEYADLWSFLFENLQ